MEEIYNGKYRKLESDPIGQGSQGEVYLCEDINNLQK